MITTNTEYLRDLPAHELAIYADAAQEFEEAIREYESLKEDDDTEQQELENLELNMETHLNTMIDLFAVVKA
ncbi:hypothetical protein AB4379_12120 [Vibrio breoganii]